MNIERLKELGKEWHSGDKHRIYINNLDRLYGLHVQRYKTGNISSASLNGEAISNARANKLLTELDGVFGKLWYDITSQQFMHKNLSADVAEILIEEIEKRCNEA